VTSKRAILINPWVCDFSAYNFWAKPIGLLRIASRLRKEGYKVKLLDYMHSPLRHDKFGCSKISKCLIDKPEPINPYISPDYVMKWRNLIV